MQVKLVVVGGDAKAAEIPLKLPAVIGRGRDASLALPHPLVSRMHCEIFESSGQLFVRRPKTGSSPFGKGPTTFVTWNEIREKQA